MGNAATRTNRTEGARGRARPLPLRVVRGADSVCLAVELGDNGELPTEFRLFTPGWNETKKGRFLFDAEAAANTLAAYKAWNVDLMIDLEHQSLDENAPVDPTARDARGWCNLELRADGSLWATNVTWTSDGAARLTDRRQRYVSPAFSFDKATRRIDSILNIAICAIPATHGTPALVAAAARGLLTMAAPDSGLPPKLVSAALEAVASKDAKGALLVLQQFLAALLGGGSTEDAPPPVGDGGADDALEPPVAAGGAVPPVDPKKDAAAAAGRMAMVMTGKTDPGQAIAELARRSQVAVDLEAREATLSADRKKLEAGERRALVASLVKLRADSPATAWSDDAGTVPCDRLLAEPIADLRARVAKLTAAATGAGGNIAPPAGTADTAPGEKEFVTPLGVVKLSVRELAMCDELKVKPEEYAADKAGKKKA